VSVTIASSTTLTGIAVVTQGNPNLDFTDAGGGSCTVGTTYAANQTCTVQVDFTPKRVGTRYGAVVLSDANGVVGTAYLQGTGIGSQTTFQPSVQSTVANFTQGISWTGAIAVDAGGSLYIADYNRWGGGLAKLYKETFSGGSYTQSVVPTSTMNSPYGVAVDGAGNIYVTDTGNWRVLKETLSTSGYTESTVASFAQTGGAAPIGVAVDGSGNVYISLGAEAGIVYKETLTPSGYTQSTVVSGLPSDTGIAVDGSGNVYVAVNLVGGWIAKATPVAGGYSQSTIPVTGAGVPFAVATDGNGDLYIALIGNNDLGHVFKETATAQGYTQSTISTSGLNQPGGIAVDGSGNVYIADSYNSRALKVDLSDPPSLSFATTRSGQTSSDSPQTVVVSNIGNAVLDFSGLNYPSDFPEASGIDTDCTASTQLSTGETCTLTIDFTPSAPLGGNASELLSENVTLTTNILNGSATEQFVAVTGTETQPLPAAATPTFLPAAGTYSSAQSVTISDTTASAIIYYTTDGTTTPTASSTRYTGAINVSTTETIQAIAVASGFSNSAVASATYTFPQDFSVAVNPAIISVQAGQSGTATVTVTPQNGINSVVSFSCSGLPSGASCIFSPASVTPAGNVASTTLTVSTSATTASLRRNSQPIFPASALVIALCCIGGKKRRRLPTLLLLAVSIASLGLLTGCGLSGDRKPLHQSVTSTVTVTAQSASLSHSITFTLIVD
jgi:hypothetical protein